MHGKISHIRQVSQWQKVNKVRMEIEERNAWQNKPHGDRKKGMHGKISHTRQASQWQKVNKVRMEIDKRNAWQNKLHEKSDNNK
jgi:hypothetical protein